MILYIHKSNQPSIIEIVEVTIKNANTVEKQEVQSTGKNALTVRIVWGY